MDANNLDSVKNQACHPSRAKLAVNLLNEAVKSRGAKPLTGIALDIGSGCGDIWPLLNSSLTYLPSDLQERYFPVIKCNLNRGYFPAVRQPALLAVLGVVEYMCQTTEFLRGIRSIGANYTLFSYTPIEANLNLYASLALASNQTRPAMENSLRRAGFQILIRKRLRVSNMIEDVYVLTLGSVPGQRTPAAEDQMSRRESRAARRKRMKRHLPPMEDRFLTPVDDSTM